MRIKLSKIEIIEIIQEKFKTTGEVEFILKDKQIKAGMLDGVQHYDSIRYLDSVEVVVEGIN